MTSSDSVNNIGRRRRRDRRPPFRSLQLFRLSSKFKSLGTISPLIEVFQLLAKIREKAGLL